MQVFYNHLRIHYGNAQSGPFRIFPGRLSVSRSFGDPEAKLNALGGNPNVLISVPDIKCFRIKKETDFIVIGCDGIFDKLSNSDIIHSIWSLTDENIAGRDINEHCGKISDVIIRNCLASSANDNLTCIFICFENFKNIIYDNYESSFRIDPEKFDKILKSLKNINYDFFIMKENELIIYDNVNTPKDRKMIHQNNESLKTLSNNIHKKTTTQKSSQKNLININSINPNNINKTEVKLKNKKFNLVIDLNTKLIPSQMNGKILSPVNTKSLNKYFSPTNANSLMSNPLMNSLKLNHNFSGSSPLDPGVNQVSSEENNLNKFSYSHKFVNYTPKLDVISPKNIASFNNFTKKNLNNKLASDEKYDNLPVIQSNPNLTKQKI